MTYPQPTYPQYPQGSPYPAAPQYPAPVVQQPLAKGTLSDFYSQPSSGGGPVLSWKNKPIGTTYSGIVARPVTSADVRQVTNPQGIPQTYRDGRPKFEMVVPLIVQASQEFPEGQARWIVRGQARDELVRAMAEAGAPEGPPEAGAAISVTLVQRRPSGVGFNPANIVQVRYVRPQGAAAVQPTEQPQPDQAQQAAPQQVGQPVQVAAPQPQQTAPTPTFQPPVEQPQQVQATPQQVAAPQPPADLSPEQQALLAQLTQQG